MYRIVHKTMGDGGSLAEVAEPNHRTNTRIPSVEVFSTELVK